MSTVSESVVVDASLAEVWDYYFDPRGWSAWVDGFARVQGSDGYPEAGGSLRWSSIPAGRGEVTEHVLEHEPRRLHRASFRDPATAGELRTTFAIEGEGTRVAQQFDYRLRRRGPFSWLTDRLFIRSQMRESLRRSLARLKLEVEEISAGSSSASPSESPG
jgi:Polyketide cyclase / dehydrase and lipid transport